MRSAGLRRDPGVAAQRTAAQRIDEGAAPQFHDEPPKNHKARLALIPAAAACIGRWWLD